MMKIGGTSHLLMVLAILLIIAGLMIIVYKSNKIVQNIIITSVAVLGTVGIFFLHGTHYGTRLDLKNLGMQMFQVCNFNFILLPLCLFKKNELARQYLFFFSMPAALSTFVTYPSDVANSMWYDIVSLNFWIDHACVVATPLLMVASRRFKPRLEYVNKVILCVFIYFFATFIANFAFNGFSFETINYNFSYTMESGSIMILEPIFKLIPVPFIYLLPLLPPIYFLFWLVAYLFKNYKTFDAFGYEFKRKK